jgi:hypothetical protein
LERKSLERAIVEMKYKTAGIFIIIILSIIAIDLLANRVLPPSLRPWNFYAEPEFTEARSPYRLAPSDRIVYQFGYESDSSLDFSSVFKGQGTSQQKVEKAPGMAQSLFTSIRGELLGKVIEKRGENLLIAYHLDSHVVTLSVNGQKAIEQEKVIRNDLGKEVYILMNSRGKIQSLRFDSDMANLSKGYFQALLAMSQIVFCEKGNPNIMEWDVQEEDLGGNYIAHYRQDSLPSEGQTSEKEPLMKNFRKTKIRYLPSGKRIGPGQTLSPKTILPEGSLIAQFDFSSGYLLSLKGSELQTILFGKKKIGQVKNNIELKLVGRETIGKKEFSLLRKASADIERLAETVSLSTNLGEKEAIVNLHRKYLGKGTLKSLLADLNTVDVTGGNYPTTLLRKFEALIYLHPESCKPIGNILASADPRGLTMRILVDALISIGHKEAQEALIAGTKARKEDSSALFILIQALGRIIEPTLETEKVLRDIVSKTTNQDIKATAQLALGSVARNLTVKSPDRAEKLISEFIQNLEPSSSEREIQQILHVLGNTGSILALSPIEKYITHSTPYIRAVAMYALRWIESKDVDPLLAKGISSDPEKLVRLEAAHALGLRKMTPETLQAQKEVLMKDSAVEVRLAVLYNLSNAFEEFPETKKLIKETAAKDPSKDVRKAASEIMVRYPKDYFK